jgi:clan AA aspartic protease (TIGR02281 family)
MNKIVSGCIALIGVFSAATSTRAAECQLKEYGSLQVEMLGQQPTTTVKINGTDTRFMLDTGAFYSMMSNASAQALNLRTRELPFGYRINGIGGSTTARYTQVKEFGILGTTLKNIEFVVGGSDAGYGLLGANLLDIADLEIDLAHGKMNLFKPDGCNKTGLAYWSKAGEFNMVDIDTSESRSAAHQTVVEVEINGKKLRAMIDSGASATVMSRHAAEHVGINLDGPNVKPGMTSSGIGSKSLKAWTVNIDSFQFGTELIQHTQMEVLDGSIGGGDTDMLLGADFLLAHRMYIANSQDKIYFTYNGGRLFALATPTSEGESAGGEKAAPLQNAADYALRGEAHLSRGEPHAAVVDLNEAIRMAPDQAAYYVARARAYMAEKQLEPATADLDKAVSLDPKNVDALLMRARIRFSHDNHAGALADINAASPLVAAGSINAIDIANLYVALDQPATALPLLNRWIQTHPNDVHLGNALNERCWALSLSNQSLDDALSDCRKAIKRDGENPQYLDSLGLVELRLGKYPESISAYEKAAQTGHSAWTRYGLGLARIRNGQKEAGDADLVAARAIQPDIDTRAAKFGLRPGP